MSICRIRIIAVAHRITEAKLDDSGAKQVLDMCVENGENFDTIEKVEKAILSSDNDKKVRYSDTLLLIYLTDNDLTKAKLLIDEKRDDPNFLFDLSIYARAARKYNL